MSGKFERDEVNNQKVIRVFSNGRRPESVARKKKRKAIKKMTFLRRNCNGNLGRRSNVKHDYSKGYQRSRNRSA